MLFDRVLEDSLGFIRRKLWAEKQGAATPPAFQSTKSVDGEFGMIHLISGRDTPRAVRTWMYTPKRQKLNAAQMVATSTPMDLHLYIDFLGPLPQNNAPSAVEAREARESQRQRGVSVATHRLQLLKASHFLNRDGFYDYDLIFWQDIDCFPPAGSGLAGKAADKIAMRFTDALAFRCLELATPLKVKSESWAAIVDDVLGQVRAKLLKPR
jgi:hypothetical protein